MAEYINREDAIRKIRDVYCTDCQNYNGVRCRACNFADAIDILEDVPTADVVEVRHARWDANGRCTECGEHAPFYGMASAYHKSPYCFGCGAKMDGGAENA